MITLMSLLVGSMALGAAMGALAVMIRRDWKNHANRVPLVLFTILVFGILSWSLWQFLSMIKRLVL